MHLLERYALSCGTKIDKPFIYESFFPNPFENYITFQAESPMDSKNYSYFQDVIDILNPILNQNKINIIQFGIGKEPPYQRVTDLRGKTNINQLAYLVRNSKLHFGPDSFGVHLASSFDIPIVALYSNSMSEHSGPYFGSKDKQILIKTYMSGNGKPSYQLQENPKTINKILPEDIASKIFKLLNIEANIPFETVHLGGRYSKNIIREFIPNTTSILGNPEMPVEIRTDIHYDEKILQIHLSYLQKAVIVTDKPISIPFLSAFKKNIPLVVYKITQNDDVQFVKNLISAGFQVVLITHLSEKDILDKKINYYPLGKINIMANPSEGLISGFKQNIDKLYYRSCKIIIDNAKVYASHAAIEKGIEMNSDFEYQKIIDSPKFWQDLDFLVS